MKGTNANSHETMSMPMVVKRIAGKIGSVRKSTIAIQNDYKTFKQTTGTMIRLVSQFFYSENSQGIDPQCPAFL